MGHKNQKIPLVCANHNPALCYWLMRSYDYRKKRITPVQQKRWERQKILFLLLAGALILGLLIYLNVTK